LSLNTIVNIEAGNNPDSTVESLQKIVNALETPIEKLLK